MANNAVNYIHDLLSRITDLQMKIEELERLNDELMRILETHGLTKELEEAKNG